jgi:type VI secretion system secreted protein Hcp
MNESKPKSMDCSVRRPLLAAALAATAVAPGPAIAAVDMFLKLDNVAGESQDSNHKGWVDTQSFDWGVSIVPSQGSGTPTGKSMCSPFHIVKSVDKSSPTLFVGAATGQHFQKAQIDVQKHDGNGVVFLNYVLQDVFVTSVANASDQESSPTENVTLNFKQITVNYRAQNADGTFTDAIAGAASCP